VATTSAAAAAAAAAFGKTAAGAGRTPTGRSWRVVAEGDAFAVYCGARRPAWGLRTREAAGRWVVRLGGALPLDPPAAKRGATRVWWDGGDR
jgi:hypothetical protein